jgi:tetratricopeptide (TPR) repeat protein
VAHDGLQDSPSTVLQAGISEAQWPRNITRNRRFHVFQKGGANVNKLEERDEPNRPQQSPKENIKQKKWLSLSDVLNHVSLFRTLVTNLLIFAIVTIFLVFAYRQINRDVVIIEPFGVPKQLNEKGFTGQVLVNKLTDQLNRIATEALLSEQTVQFSAAWLEQSADFDIPATGVSLEVVLDLLREFFGTPPTRIVGELVFFKDDSLDLTTRIAGKQEEVVRGTLNDLDALLVDSAKYIYRITQPYLLAVYLYNTSDDKTMAIDVLTQNCLQNDRTDDDIPAYNLWGNALYTQKRYDEAIEKYETAVRLNPEYDHANYNWGNALYATGQYQEAAEKYKRTTDINPGYEAAYFDRGNALSALGEEGKATESYEQAYTLNPQAKVARTEISKRNLTAADLNQLFRSFGLTRKPSPEETVQILNANAKRDSLREEYPDIAKRRAITIQYFPKDVDRKTVEQAIKELGFELTIITPKPKLEALPTNAIWFGSEVGAENVKLIAYTLIRAGVNIKAIRPFRNQGSRNKIVQVGSDGSLVYRTASLTVKDIEATGEFTR